MKKSVLFITRSALVAAIYFALSVALQVISFGPIQFRLSDALVLLPIFMPEAIPGLTIGCFLTNFFFSPYGLYDMLFGTLATLLGCIGTYLLRKNIFISAIPPIIFNAFLVPIVFAMDNVQLYYIGFFEILLSEFIVAGVIGIPFTIVLRKALYASGLVKPIGSKYISQPYVREDRSKDNEDL